MEASARHGKRRKEETANRRRIGSLGTARQKGRRKEKGEEELEAAARHSRRGEEKERTKRKTVGITDTDTAWHYKREGERKEKGWKLLHGTTERMRERARRVGILARHGYCTARHSPERFPARDL